MSENLLKYSNWFINCSIEEGLVEVKSPSSLRVKKSIFGKEYCVAMPVTFTPFASVKSCSANCIFCSETLRPKSSKILSSSLRPKDSYFYMLKKVVSELNDIPLGVSLSGLEMTDDYKWFAKLLSTLKNMNTYEKVLYTNLAGLCSEKESAFHLSMKEFAMSRIEVSRHHFSQGYNQTIMRFKPGEQALYNDVFESKLKNLTNAFNVRLVCIVQKLGVSDMSSVEKYLYWAMSLGVKDVVFREFSVLGDLYQENKTFHNINNNRISIDSLLSELYQSKSLGDFKLTKVESGYYYWNANFNWKSMSVRFETSDYTEMKEKHRSGDIHKLVFHAN